MIEGPTVRAIFGDREIGEAELQQLAEMVMTANPDLVGLPSGSGSGVLKYENARFLETGTRLTFRQHAVLRGGTIEPLLNRGTVRFFINQRGELSYIDNETRSDLTDIDPAMICEEEACEYALSALKIVEIQTGQEHLTLPFDAHAAEVIGRGVFIRDDGPPRVAYMVSLDGTMGQWKGGFIVYIDGVTGELLDYCNRQIYGGGITWNAQREGPTNHYEGKRGLVETYDPNPLQNTVLTRTVYGLELTTKHLYGQVTCTAHNEQVGDAVGSGPYFSEFLFYNAPWPDSYHLNKATVYYAISGYLPYLENEGFGGLMTATPPVPVEAMYTWYATSCYDYVLKKIYILGSTGFVHAADIETIWHELCHYLSHMVGGSGPYGFPFDTMDKHNRAICEAVADFPAQSKSNDPYCYEWAAQNASLPYYRTILHYRTMDNYGGDIYFNSTIFSGALWDMRSIVGNGIVDPLVYQSINYYLPTDDFSAIEPAMLQADFDLFGGKYADIILKLLSLRKISAPYPWPTTYPVSLPRPYDAGINDWQIYSVPGAAELAVTLDNLTSIYMSDDGLSWDYLEITDGNDVVITTVKDRDGRNMTVLVPGDTVKFHLVTQSGSGAGYLVEAIEDTTNNTAQPVAVLNASTASGMAPLKVDFDAGDSHDPNGYIAAMTVDLGDGTMLYLDLDTPEFSWNFDRLGILPMPEGQTTTFNVALTVTDNQGASSTTTQVIEVLPRPGY